MTDALGGVDVCVRASPHVETGVDDTGRPYRATNLDDPFSQFHAAPGTVHLDGEQALAFVRQRHGFPDGDLSRIRRQQTFLGAVVRTATSSRILSDPVTVTRLLNAATGVLTVDDQTSVNDLEALAGRLRGSTRPSGTSRPSPPTHPPQVLRFRLGCAGSNMPPACHQYLAARCRPPLSATGSLAPHPGLPGYRLPGDGLHAVLAGTPGLARARNSERRSPGSCPAAAAALPVGAAGTRWRAYAGGAGACMR